MKQTRMDRERVRMLPLLALALTMALVLCSCSVVPPRSEADGQEVVAPASDTPTVAPTLAPTVAPAETIEVQEPSAPAEEAPATQTLGVETFGLTLGYPSSWGVLQERVGAPPSADMPASQLVVLSDGGYRVLIHIKDRGDATVVGGAMPPGTVLADGEATLLGRQTSRNVLVQDGRTKLAWYSASTRDIELYVRVEAEESLGYEEVDIPAAFLGQVEAVLASVALEGGDQQSAMGEPVNGWEGTLLSTPQWPQIDDCFQRADDGQCYGIVFADPVLRGLAEGYRDSGTLLRIWGALYRGRMDAGDAQIEATRVEAAQPLPQVRTQEVEEWWGVVVSNPPGAQFDDYFQMMDQNGTRYGIDSLDDAIRSELVALRDTGRVIQVWGTLSLDVPDAYGGQIQVTRWVYAP